MYQFPTIFIYIYQGNLKPQKKTGSLCKTGFSIENLGFRELLNFDKVPKFVNFICFIGIPF